MSSKLHQPVLLNQAVELLAVQPDKWYVDTTFGRGGHTRAVLERQGKVIAFDHDATAIEYGQQEFSQNIAQKRLILIRENFDQLLKQVRDLQTQKLVGQVAGILFDFGTSVDQLKDERRGFSFDADGPLDMRMDDRLGVTAYDLLYLLSEKQLEGLLRDQGGEEMARAIAQTITRYKQAHGQPPRTTRQLADLISSVKRSRSHLHPATKVFQALRMAVNSELVSIEKALPQAFALLEPGGRLVTIAFHEGEDRLCKKLMRQLAQSGQAELLTKKPLTPSTQELAANPRARSAKLRALEKSHEKNVG